MNKQDIESAGFECVVDEGNYMDFIKDDLSLSLYLNPYLITIYRRNVGQIYMGEPNSTESLKRILNEVIVQG